MDQRLLQLRDKVNGLMSWMSSDKEQPITVDNYGKKSQVVMQKDHLVAYGTQNGSGIGGDVSIEVRIGGVLAYLPASKIS